MRGQPAANRAGRGGIRQTQGRDGALIDQPNATDAAAADAEWVLETYEPRVNAEEIVTDPSGVLSGEFNMTVNITERKEDEEIE